VAGFSKKFADFFAATTALAYAQDAKKNHGWASAAEVLPFLLALAIARF
jgi:hypothetical protein